VSGHQPQANRCRTPVFGRRGRVEGERHVTWGLQLLPFESESHTDGQAESLENEIVVRQGRALPLKPDLRFVWQQEGSHLGGSSSRNRDSARIDPQLSAS